MLRSFLSSLQSLHPSLESWQKLWRFQPNLHYWQETRRKNKASDWNSWQQNGLTLPPSGKMIKQPRYTASYSILTLLLPNLIQILLPLRVKYCPQGDWTAMDLMEAASEPLAGSVRQKAATCSPGQVNTHMPGYINTSWGVFNDHYSYHIAQCWSPHLWQV